MKSNMKYILTLIGSLMVFAMMSCQKLLDKEPQTQVITQQGKTASITATDAENLIAGVYDAETGYAFGLESNVLDKITNGDVRSDNCYAGGDNPDNISIDLFTDNALNGNIARDWSDSYGIIGVINSAIDQISGSTDPALTQTRKNQMLGEASFMRAYTYFYLVRLYGRVPVMLKPVDQSNSEALIKSTLVAQSATDTVYQAILNDLHFALANVRDDNTAPNKQIISKGAVNAVLAKVYASMPTPNWDSVAYYCDQVIPNYSLLSDYTWLWDNNHKNNSEAIWEFNYVGYSVVGNWIPSQFIGAGWKKFETPTNDLVNAFTAASDNIRMNASIQFVNYGWADPYWTNTNYYPILAKYNDPNNGINDWYALRLADILLLRAEAYNQLGHIPDAEGLVNLVRARVSLPPVSGNSQADMEDKILNERRLELAFEGKRWFDLVRTGKAVSTMNAQKDGTGSNLNYNVQDFRLVYPIPQTQLDLNPLLTQNAGY